jgi:hypothetical protein
MKREIKNKALGRSQLLTTFGDDRKVRRKSSPEKFAGGSAGFWHLVELGQPLGWPESGSRGACLVDLSLVGGT